MLLFASITDDGQTQHQPVIDDILILNIARGDKKAFSSLYQLTSQSIYAYALSILKNPADAEDVLQDTFLKIRSAAALYTPNGTPLSWILTITRNLCLMKIRRQSHLACQPVDDLSLESSLNYISDSEDRIVLKTTLQLLSDEECQIIILHAITGWKHREIAKLLQLPVSTVLSKYHRGLKKLKTELEGIL